MLSIKALKHKMITCEVQRLHPVSACMLLHDVIECVQVVLEVHDTEGRLDKITQLLKAKSFLVSCKQGLAPFTYMVYARSAS